MSEAGLRLTRSRERIRRYLARQDDARSETQRGARQRRTQWTLLALGLAVAGLVWTKPWRRAAGLIGALAWVSTAAKASGMLSTLTGTITQLTGWWQAAQAKPSSEAQARTEDPTPPEPVPPQTGRLNEPDGEAAGGRIRS